MNKEDVIMMMGFLEGILQGIEEYPEVTLRFAKLLYKINVDLIEAGFTEEQAFELVRAGIAKK